MTFLYLHGFNSDGDGWKARALRKHFSAATVLAPDLPAEPYAVVAQLEDLLSPLPEQLVVLGTSLGGFYAYFLSAQWQVPALLFNPSLQPYHTLEGRGVGQFQTWTKQRDYHFKRAYLAQLRQLKKLADTRIDVKRLRFFLATDDDLLDHRHLPELYPEAYISWIDGAGHGFSKFEKVLKQAKKEGWFR
ncbi:MAG: alpha/beta fold hydrolase [Bacteroidetes bacterium]|nr:MAG: alpha/beta fold hydrolase [Bacteroidota bacterium]